MIPTRCGAGPPSGVTGNTHRVRAPSSWCGIARACLDIRGCAPRAASGCRWPHRWREPSICGFRSRRGSTAGSSSCWCPGSGEARLPGRTSRTKAPASCSRHRTRPAQA
ncbi:hypothetical protein G6F68_018539 [Rhizopus microsporus]|nr:hypothetical protein G6F68_018539 [Rhizopus microsporus]